MKRPKLTKEHYHEFIDRMHVITSNIDTHIIQHPICKLDKEICTKVEKAMDLLYEAYQLGGSRQFQIIENIELDKEVITQSKIKQIGLLNYEDDVLKLQKIGDSDAHYQFRVIDQWKRHIGLYTASDILLFITGAIDIIDSKNNTWNFATAHENAKPNVQEVLDFIK